MSVGISLASLGSYLLLVAAPAASTQSSTIIPPGSGAERTKAFSLRAEDRQACLAQFPSIKQLEAIAQIAQQVSVAVFSQNSGGSGVTIARTNGQYWVLTNEHVLRHGRPYRVQMHDGRIYSATPIAHINFANDDLALLQFSAPSKHYPLAALAPAQPLTHQMPLLASGFPHVSGPDTTNQMFPEGSPVLLGEEPLPPLTNAVRNTRSPRISLHLTCGRLSQILNQPLLGGYQIGYTNPILKGMSGGPVLNQHGQVVAINGMHAYPLWGNPYVYGDGRISSPQEVDSMSQLSWAIPIRKAMQRLL